MDGNKLNSLLDDLFTFAKETMQTKQIYPYVSFVVKNGIIVSRGFNDERETRDITNQGDVVAIRNAQQSLDTSSLSGYTLVSFFEPTILGFDVALWAGISDFIWCINSSSLPKQYNKLKYTPLDYAKHHPGKLTIQHGLREKEAMKLTKIAKEKKFYPDNLM